MWRLIVWPSPWPFVEVLQVRSAGINREEIPTRVEECTLLKLDVFPTAVLVLYLTSELLYDEASATAIFHAFTSLCYFTPIFGAWMADFVLGKFRTILYLSLVYALGEVILSAASVPSLLPARAFSLLGLVLIASGTGGIKPCVSSFGGDQFREDQKRLLGTFFMLYYLATNFGGLISMLVTPVLRADVRCFESPTCFPLAFGLPALLMVVSTVIFVCGRPTYRKAPASGGEATRLVGCVAHAITRRWKAGRESTRRHWLDHADDRYNVETVSEAKSCLRLLPLFLPLPIFWALFDQQGSTWTLQATKLDPQVLGYELKPDQLQAANPLLIIIFIPLFEFAIYPLMDKCHLLTRPLQKMTVGGLLAGLSFVLAGLLQLSLENNLSSYPIDCNRFQITNGLLYNRSVEILSPSSIVIPNQLEENLDSTKKQARIRLLSSLENVTFYLADSHHDVLLISPPTSEYINLNPGKYELYIVHDNTWDDGGFIFDNSDTYDIMVNNKTSDKLNWWCHRNTPSNSFSILLQLPQYFLITAGEIMFSITGLAFSYSQAPESLKSFIQALWLLTNAFGNLIVLVIAEIKIFERQSYEFFLFAGLMIADMAIFATVAYFYTYVEFTKKFDVQKKEEMTSEEHLWTDWIKREFIRFQSTTNTSFHTENTYKSLFG